MKLGILRTDTVRPEWACDFGQYPDMFVTLMGRADPTLEFVTYDVESGQYPEDIDEVDAYLITGSKSSVYDDKPWILPLIEFVKEIAARNKKIIGICFGHQLVAQALGGKTEKSDKGWGAEPGLSAMGSLLRRRPSAFLCLSCGYNRVSTWPLRPSAR